MGDHRRISDMLDNLPAPGDYKFTPDPEESLKEKGDVVFLLGLNSVIDGYDIDPNTVRERIKGMTSNIGFMNYFSWSQTMLCRSNKSTYESMFGCELLYDAAMQGESGYTPEGYKQLDFAVVPEGLSDLVNRVHLNLTRRL